MKPKESGKEIIKIKSEINDVEKKQITKGKFQFQK